ncbi:inverse autotransporter beta domain-containing protein [Xenorhabdus khoisanae]|uniref:inverse autotransporter beta domain-containing protein n=1 Tax=Xenorhabdus khoisanae TaxID=880157 RepID=UPI00069FC6E2|nr:inverse autotransporter beta-barrel domain-containing protein [Xenorhabdus khoisanae]
MSNKFIRFGIFIYSLFLPFITMSALAVGESQPEHQMKEIFLPKTENEDNRDNEKKLKEDLMVQGLQKVGSLLSSSPSQLTEQAKSYALGKLNSTVTGEAQKWLSQFGTAKINLSMDRKGKLDNSSLDFLLPLYDNKADWLFFTQVGYRNKDSRNTINFGLGGRYFTPGWMYGLNTFYDYDLTGKNKRMGLGGEAWADYVKLSANTYLRLSDWHQSMEDKDFEERPANGFDLNGEFFLPAYPNLGGKLSYEQYFGDNVSLFNRSTKQKNPSLARFGLSYTPIPLVTMGVDYKHGSGGRSETLFLANLNYRFGVPLGVQLSTDSVASMRTLAGSRYDLVERNNNIVLDYRKKAILEMMLPDTITGYSGEKRQIVADIRADKLIKKITWSADGAFSHNGGSILENGQTIDLTLPNYNPKGTNSYEIFAVAEDETDNQSERTIRVIVEPISVKTSITPNRPVGANGLSPYTLTVTLSSGKDNHPLSHTEFKGAQWTYEYPGMPKEGDNVAKPQLEAQTNITNQQGQLIAKLISAVEAKDIKVYLEIPGLSKILVNKTEPINFGQYSFQLTQMESAPKGSVLISDSSNPNNSNNSNKSNNAHIFKAVVVDAFGAPVKGIPGKGNDGFKIKWVTEPDNTSVIIDSSSVVDEQGQLFATVKSTKAQTVKVGIAIKADDPIPMPGSDNGSGNHSYDPPVYFDDPVVFVDDKQKLGVKFDFEPSSASLKADGSQYTVTATVTNKDGKPYQETVNPVWNIISLSAAPGATITAVDSKPGGQGKFKAVLRSTQGIKNAKVGLTLNGGVEIQSQAFDFIPEDPSDAAIKGSLEVSPEGPLLANMKGKATYKALMIESTTGNPLKNQTFKDVSWEVVPDKGRDKPESLRFIDVQNTTDDKGYLTASLVSSAGLDGVVAQVSVNVNNKPQAAKAKPVSFNAVERETVIRTTDKYNSFSLGRPVTVSDQVKFVFAHISDSHGLQISDLDPQIFDVQYNVPAGSSIEVDTTGPEKALWFPPQKFKPEPVKVTANVTNKTTGEKYLYSYQFNPLRYVFVTKMVATETMYPPVYFPPNTACENLEPKESLHNIKNVKSVTIDMLGQLVNVTSKNTISSDYKDLRSIILDETFPIQVISGNNGDTVLSGEGFYARLFLLKTLKDTGPQKPQEAQGPLIDGWVNYQNEKYVKNPPNEKGPILPHPSPRKLFCLLPQSLI